MENERKIAAIQLCSSHDVDDNLHQALAYIKDAAIQGARVAVLPEMFAMMPLKDTDMASFPLDAIKEQLSLTAKQNNIWIIAGTLPLPTSNGKYFAATLVFNHEGEIIAQYNKIHLFDVTLPDEPPYRESDTYEPGDAITVIDTPIGRVGLAVCYDLRFPEFFRAMQAQGADVFVLPAAFTRTTGKAHWDILTRARAIENFAYVITACQEGEHTNGRETYGHSAIISPWGEIMAEKESGEGIIFSVLNKEKQESIKRHIPMKPYFSITDTPAC